MADNPDDEDAAQAHHLRHQTAVRDHFDLDAHLRQARFVYELLNQTQVWIDARRVRHRIDDMSIGYKANVLAFLRRRAGVYGSMYGWGEIGSLGAPSWREVLGEINGEVMYTGHTFSEFDLMGDQTRDNFDRWQVEREELIRRDPVTWMESTALVRRLIDDVAHDRGGVVGDRPEDAPARADGRALCPQCGREFQDTTIHQRGQSIPTLVRICTGEWFKL